jgi:hypothetical protein
MYQHSLKENIVMHVRFQVLSPVTKMIYVFSDVMRTSVLKDQRFKKSSSYTLMFWIDVAGLSETSVPIYQTIWCDIIGDSNLDSRAPFHVACTIQQAIHCYDSDGMVEEHYQCTCGRTCDRAYWMHHISTSRHIYIWSRSVNHYITMLIRKKKVN